MKQGKLSLRVPMIPHSETTRYRIIGQKSKEVSGHITQVVNKLQENGKDYYKVHTTTEYVQGDIAEETSILEADGWLRPVSSHRVVKSQDNEVLLDTTLSFPENLSDLPENAILPGLDGALFCFRGCTFVPKGNIEVHSVMPEGNPLKQRGTISKDMVKVQAGTFECYKVEAMADTMEMMGMSMPGPMQSLIERFFPSSCTWYSAQDPHHLVMFQGHAFSVIGTMRSQAILGEEIIWELLSIESPSS